MGPWGPSQQASHSTRNELQWILFFPFINRVASASLSQMRSPHLHQIVFDGVGQSFQSQDRIGEDPTAWGVASRGRIGVKGPDKRPTVDCRDKLHQSRKEAGDRVLVDWATHHLSNAAIETLVGILPSAVGNGKAFFGTNPNIPL